jgi:hypothetical protein
MRKTTVRKTGNGWETIQGGALISLVAGLIWTCAFWTDARPGQVNQAALNSAVIALGSFLMFEFARLGARWSHARIEQERTVNLDQDPWPQS